MKTAAGCGSNRIGNIAIQQMNEATTRGLSFRAQRGISPEFATKTQRH